MLISDKKKLLKIKNLKMDFKKLAIDLLVVTAGVLIAFKVKEQMDKAKVSAPTK